MLVSAGARVAVDTTAPNQVLYVDTSADIRTAELRGSVAASSFIRSASFDADGTPLSVGISDQRGGPGVGGAAGVGSCLRALGVEVGDVSPGASVTVEVPLALP